MGSRNIGQLLREMVEQIRYWRTETNKKNENRDQGIKAMNFRGISGQISQLEDLQPFSLADVISTKINLMF